MNTTWHPVLSPGGHTVIGYVGYGRLREGRDICWIAQDERRRHIGEVIGGRDVAERAVLSDWRGRQK